MKPVLLMGDDRVMTMQVVHACCLANIRQGCEVDLAAAVTLARLISVDLNGGLLNAGWSMCTALWQHHMAKLKGHTF